MHTGSSSEQKATVSYQKSRSVCALVRAISLSVLPCTFEISPRLLQRSLPIPSTLRTSVNAQVELSDLIRTF
jgi:hypothetical protein